MPVEGYGLNDEVELAVVRQMLADPVLMSRLAPYLHPERFRNEDVKLAAEGVLGYHKQYGSPPTPVALLQEVRRRVEEGKVKAERVQTCALMLEQASEAPPIDSTYAFDLIIQAERKAAVWSALDQGLRTFRGGDYESIAKVLTSAATLGASDLSLGVELGPTLGERTQNRRDGKEPPRWGTGIVDLDDMIRGGLAAGELGCVLGGPKFGKSQFLGSVALHAMSLGGTVIYYTMELSEREVSDRFDAAISRTRLDQLGSKADYVHETVEAWLSEKGGACIIKQFPSGEPTVRTLEAHMRQLRAERSVCPTLIVVDYGDLMSGGPGGSDRRYEELGSVYTDLRGLACTWKMPVWTASQAKRDALSKKIVSMVDMAESFKKVAIADLVVALCGTEEERADGVIRFYVAACRYASSNIQVGPFKTNFAEGRIILDPSEEEVG